MQWSVIGEFGFRYNCKSTVRRFKEVLDVYMIATEIIIISLAKSELPIGIPPPNEDTCI